MMAQCRANSGIVVMKSDDDGLGTWKLKGYAFYYRVVDLIIDLAPR